MNETILKQAALMTEILLKQSKKLTEFIENYVINVCEAHGRTIIRCSEWTNHHYKYLGHLVEIRIICQGDPNIGDCFKNMYLFFSNKPTAYNLNSLEIYEKYIFLKQFVEKIEPNI